MVVAAVEQRLQPGVAVPVPGAPLEQRALVVEAPARAWAQVLGAPAALVRARCAEPAVPRVLDAVQAASAPASVSGAWAVGPQASARGAKAWLHLWERGELNRQRDIALRNGECAIPGVARRPTRAARWTQLELDRGCGRGSLPPRGPPAKRRQQSAPRTWQSGLVVITLPRRQAGMQKGGRGG